jgi:hypothetical protein
VPYIDSYVLATQYKACSENLHCNGHPHATFAKGCQLWVGCLSGKERYSAHRKELSKNIWEIKKALGSSPSGQVKGIPVPAS